MALEDSAWQAMPHFCEIGCIQTAFAKDVRNMLSAMDELGNLFLEDSKDLIAKI